MTFRDFHDLYESWLIGGRKIGGKKEGREEKRKEGKRKGGRQGKEEGSLTWR